MRHRLKGMTIAMVCPKHGFIRGDHCEECRQAIGVGPAVHIFKPMVYTDICATPLLIESKKQLKAECKKHNVIACRLM